MKLFCSGDFHGLIPLKIEEISKKIKVNAILITGDFWPHYGEIGTEKNVIDFLLSIKIPIYSIFGNIDNPEILERISKENKNFNLIHLKRIKLGDYYLVGIGDYHFFHSKNIETVIEKLISESPSRTILLTHYPPYRTKLDVVYSGSHVGDRFLRDMIEKYQPLLVVCGHIHEARGIDTINEVLIVNPGPVFQGSYATIDVNGDVQFSLNGM